MDKNRKILVSIMVFLLLSVILSLININMNMTKYQGKMLKFGSGIGVIEIYGIINIENFSSGSDAIIKQITEFENDQAIKAIVIRINSPGGTVGATQEIFKKIMQFRKTNKPVIASMADVAASGGYYIASACNKIYANYGTITGSIGVIIRNPNLKGLFDKLGIEMRVIKSGKYKDILSSSRDMTIEEKKLIQDMIDSTYLQFLKDVSLGRNILIDSIKPYADGRVMNGVQAKKINLIDEIGCLDDAIREAKKMAKLDENAPVYYVKKDSLLQLRELLNNKFYNGLSSVMDTNNNALLEYRYIP